MSGTDMRDRSRAEQPPNHLIGEKSPYLQQHARNPVDWYPWSEEAFRRAGNENRPVFLSIGYATCHWCHVMARESFGDPGIAALLNNHFISIKVDREERPDIDSVYMAACQKMTGGGGWPLTVIMTPEKKPFFAGTYFPPETRSGMTGLAEILRRIIDLWREQRQALLDSGDQLAAAIAADAGAPVPGTAGPDLLQDAFEDLKTAFDQLHGGFGRAPKFPTPARILFLLRYYKRTGSGQALQMAEQTLDAMRAGGMYDHVGGGFHRYSTDAAWRLPHFEKMLYDQALLLMAYAEAWQVTKKARYRKTAEEIIAYVLRDLTAPEGAFLTAEDADSPGGEGEFYLWTRQEFDAVLGSGDGTFAASLFHVRSSGNLPGGEGNGKNILYLSPGNETGDEARISGIRGRLFAARQGRPRPERDTKILTDGNGLMIAALADASRIFGEPEYYPAAVTAMQFLLNHAGTPEGGLMHRYLDGEAAVRGLADDYAWIIFALLRLYEAGSDPAWLGKAIGLHAYTAEHFADPETGGFFTVSDAGESLIARRTEIYDGAVPSSNSVMLRNLVLLGHLTGDPEYEKAAAHLAGAFAGTVACSPAEHAAFLCGLDHLLGPATDCVIAGDLTDAGTMDLIRSFRDPYLPSGTLQVRSRSSAAVLDRLAPFTSAMPVPDKGVAAYVCTGRSCSAPVTTPEQLEAILKKKRPAG